MLFHQYPSIRILLEKLMRVAQAFIIQGTKVCHGIFISSIIKKFMHYNFPLAGNFTKQWKWLVKHLAWNHRLDSLTVKKILQYIYFFSNIAVCRVLLLKFPNSVFYLLVLFGTFCFTPLLQHNLSDYSVNNQRDWDFLTCRR